MTAPELLVPARYYLRFMQMLERDRVDVSAMLGELRLSLRLFSDADATLRFSDVDRLMQHVHAVAPRTDLAFELGGTLTASTHSLVGFGMLSSDTLDQALRFEAQYFRLVMPSFRMRYSSGPDFGELYVTPRVAMSHICLGFHLEAIAMAALREVSDLTGGRRPASRLDLSMPEPPHVARYRELRDVQVRFGFEATPGVRLRLLEDPARFPVAMADANARRVAEERCSRLVRQMADVRQFSDWIAMTLREVSDALPSLDELAAMLNLSRRTLNRYLEREGTSFREIHGRVQHELACERLATGAMSVTDVAYSLGFSDVSNFSRAFRSRARCSPGDYRRSMLHSNVAADGV